MINAVVTTDDRNVSLTFDATDWFVQASDIDILTLAACSWSNDYPADSVAIFFDNTTTKDIFDYVAILQKADKEVGFECQVDPHFAMAWLKDNRPLLYAALQQVIGQQASDNLSRATDDWTKSTLHDSGEIAAVSYTAHETLQKRFFTSDPDAPMPLYQRTTIDALYEKVNEVMEACFPILATMTDTIFAESLVAHGSRVGHYGLFGYDPEKIVCEQAVVYCYPRNDKYEATDTLVMVPRAAGRTTAILKQFLEASDPQLTTVNPAEAIACFAIQVDDEIRVLARHSDDTNYNLGSFPTQEAANTACVEWKEKYLLPKGFF